MGYSFKAGPNNQSWDSFHFVSEKSSILDIAMNIAKFEMDNFEPGGSEWAASWGDIANQISATCTKNRSRVAWLRISCHGNVGAFKVGRSVFTTANMHQWTPVVSQIAGFFVPSVSFVTIDSCMTGRDDSILQGFSKALGGVSVRGYEEIQTKSTSEENDRGPFVTCRATVCTRHKGI